MKKLILVLLLVPIGVFANSDRRTQALQILHNHHYVFDALIENLFLYSFMTDSHPAERAPLIMALDAFAADPEVKSFMLGSLHSKSDEAASMMSDTQETMKSVAQSIFTNVEKRSTLKEEKLALPSKKKDHEWIQFWLDKTPLWFALLKELLPLEHEKDNQSYPVLISLSLMLTEIGYLMDKVDYKGSEVLASLTLPIAMPGFGEHEKGRAAANLYAQKLHTFETFYREFLIKLKEDLGSLKWRYRRQYAGDLLSRKKTWKEGMKDQAHGAFKSFQFLSAYQVAHMTIKAPPPLSPAQLQALSQAMSALGPGAQLSLQEVRMRAEASSGHGMFSSFGGAGGWGAFLVVYLGASALEKFWNKVNDEVNFAAPHIEYAKRAVNFWLREPFFPLTYELQSNWTNFRKARLTALNNNDQWPADLKDPHALITKDSENLCKGIFAGEFPLKTK